MNPAPGLRDRMQASWAAGDFSKVGSASVLVGELLCEAAQLRAGERVLDVATGAGNTALSAARRATDVTGVDFVPALLERARERQAAEGLKKIVFQLADADALPFPDGSFDAVLSTFGHMFAPDPARTTAEMARVCRPGGRVAFAAWTPSGFVGRQFALSATFRPPPAGIPAPVLWGEENIVRERFAPYARDFRFERRHLITRAPSFQAWFSHRTEFFGPTRLLWEGLDENRRSSYISQMLALVSEFNTSGDQTLFIPGEYLESVVSLR